MKVMFMRGNEHLRDGIEDVGGNRVYGGVILSKNPKNNLKWLKVNKTNTHKNSSANPFLISFFLSISHVVEYASISF